MDTGDTCQEDVNEGTGWVCGSRIVLVLLLVFKSPHSRFA